jgi:hypothetical protein
MNWDLDSILDQSITQIAAGKARVESCLLAYPTLAGELEPMLLAAKRLQEIPKPTLSPAAKARIEAQVLAAAAANPQLAPPARRWMPVALPSWRWALNALVATVMVVFLLMTTLVTVSADALPGSTFYPVKLAAEDVWLWAAPERSRPALHLRFAHRRLVEVEELAKQGVIDGVVLEAMADYFDAALDGLEDLPPAIALPLLDEAAGFIEEQQASLSSMSQVLPPAARMVIERALARSEAQTERVHTLMSTMRSGESELPVATLEPVAPLAVTLTPNPTQTAEPTLTPTTEPTGTLAATPTLEPTAGTQTVTPIQPPPASTQPPSASTQPPPPPTSTQPPPTQPPPTQPPPTQPPPTQPPPTQPPPTQPPPTQPPPEPTATERVPPGLTNTPQPPGLTKTPRPNANDKQSGP